MADSARDEVDDASSEDNELVKLLIELLAILQDKFDEVKRVIANMPSDRRLSRHENAEHFEKRSPASKKVSSDTDETEFEVIYEGDKNTIFNFTIR